MTPTQTDSTMPELDYLRWRDELLQVMYWMLGEGLGDRPSASMIENFLSADPAVIRPTLRRMTDEGYITEVSEGCFALSSRGLGEGKRSFSDEFHGLTHQGHGECSPDCTFCHSPEGDPSECPSKKVSHLAVW